MLGIAMQEIATKKEVSVNALAETSSIIAVLKKKARHSQLNSCQSYHRRACLSSLRKPPQSKLAKNPFRN